MGAPEVKEVSVLFADIVGFTTMSENMSPAAVALILAPQSGQQTRAQIKETADDALGRVRDSIDDLKGKVDDLAAQTKEAGASKMGQRPNPAQGDVAGATDEAAAGA